MTNIPQLAASNITHAITGELKTLKHILETKAQTSNCTDEKAKYARYAVSTQKAITHFQETDLFGTADDDSALNLSFILIGLQVKFELDIREAQGEFRREKNPKKEAQSRDYHQTVSIVMQMLNSGTVVHHLTRIRNEFQATAETSGHREHYELLRSAVDAMIKDLGNAPAHPDVIDCVQNDLLNFKKLFNSFANLTKDPERKVAYNNTAEHYEQLCTFLKGPKNGR